MSDPLDAFWSVPTANLLGQLGTTPEGLASHEARRRLARLGPNVLKPSKQSGEVLLLLGQFKSPLILILLFAAGLSFFLHDSANASIILVIVLASGVLGFWQERGAAHAVDKLLEVVQNKATALRDGAPQEVPVAEIVSGDVVLLSAGKSIPGDCLVIESRDLFLDEATLTGETYPVTKVAGVVTPDAPLGQRANTPLHGHPRGQRQRRRGRRPHGDDDRVRQGGRAVAAAVPGNGVRARGAAIRLPPHGGHAGARDRDLRGQRVLPATGAPSDHLLARRGRRPDASVAAGHHQHQPRPWREADGGRQGHRPTPVVDRELRQHERALLRQDGNPHRGSGPRPLRRGPGRPGERRGAPLRLPQRRLRNRPGEPDRRGDPQPPSVRPDRVHEARRGAVRLHPQAPDRTCRGQGPARDGDQGGAGRSARGLLHRQDGRRHRRGDRGGPRANRRAVRRPLQPGISHDRRRVARPGIGSRGLPGPGIRHGVRRHARPLRPAQGRGGEDDREPASSRRHCEDDHGRQPPGGGAHERAGRPVERPGP